MTAPGSERLAALSPGEREALCREVLAGLSDLVEGEAPPDLCARVEAVLAGCQPFEALRATLVATIALLRSEGEEARPAGFDEDRFRHAVERVRARLDGDGRGLP